MGQSLNTGLVQAEVETTVTMPEPSAAQTVIIKEVETTDGTDVTAYTVPAGKIFYLFGLWCGRVGAYTLYAGIDGLTAYTQRILKQTSTASGPALKLISSVPLAKLIATQELHIKLSGVGDTTVYWGVLVDA